MNKLTLVLGLAVGVLAVAAFKTHEQPKVAVFGRTLKPCPPHCVTWNGNIKTVLRSE